MKNFLRLIFVTLFSVSVSAVVVQAQNYDLVSDSLAFVAASWKVTPLERGGSAMYAQVNMFNSVQSVSVVKYPAKKFMTEILHRPGESAGTPSAIGKEIGAAVVMNGGYFHVKETQMRCYSPEKTSDATVKVRSEWPTFSETSI